MLIEKDKSLKNALSGKVILLTGAGGGIGFEAAKAFVYMGSKVIIAEIDNEKGEYAERYLNNTFSGHLADFYKIDLADDKQIMSMYDYINREYGCPDVIFHNATITAMGAVEEVPLQMWDKSYMVNFRAPLLLTQLFLPGMKRRNTGTIVFVPSSGAAPYMGAYEVFKIAQVELCNTLSGELEKTNVNTFSIGPGLVKTETAMKGIKVVSNMIGMTTEEFYEMNEGHILGVEEAGCGFALSVLLADKYNGQEIGSIQVLLKLGLLENKTEQDGKKKTEYEKIIPLVKKIIKIYKEQYDGWIARNIFERQWVLRDFKKTVGVSAEQFLINMKNLEVELENENYQILSTYSGDFEKLREYYTRQYKLLQGFEKEPAILEKHSNTLKQWIADLNLISERI
ncbi:SDR family oxidoreductase [Proteiniborus sp.]|uniref:SDR family NAD(P)-dependent oxidoreductase n=1 Tax=Proteiniborus sp. TaxID=2079015 RepID=UPI00331E5FF5